MTNKISLFCLVYLIGTSCSFLKDDTNYASVLIPDRKELRDNYMKYGKEVLGIESADKLNRLFRCNLNLKKIKELNEIADKDVLSLVQGNGFSNYISASILRPQVVVGTVTERVYDASEGAFFHTEWTVKVDEIIADDGKEITLYNGEDVFMKSIMGLRSDGTYLSITHAPKLRLGQEVLLFIAPVRDLGRRRALSTDELILEKFNIKRVEDINSTFTVSHVSTIKNEFVISRGSRIGKLKEIKEQIKKIVKVNNRNQFYADFRD